MVKQRNSEVAVWSAMMLLAESGSSTDVTYLESTLQNKENKRA